MNTLFEAMYLQMQHSFYCYCPKLSNVINPSEFPVHQIAFYYTFVQSL